MKYMRDPNLAGSGPAGTGVNFIGLDPTVQDSPRINIKGDYQANGASDIGSFSSDSFDEVTAGALINF